MNQPDLGLKITDLRQLKGLTQEKLAEYCEVSTRTIQRIESGEVEPRSFTRNSLSNILEFDLGKENTNNENLWLTILHLSSIFCFAFIPLLLWSWKKDQSYRIDRQGREVLNFQITIMLLLFALALMDSKPGILNHISTFLPIPILLIGIFTSYQAVVNTVRGLSNKPIHYSLSIPFVR